VSKKSEKKKAAKKLAEAALFALAQEREEAAKQAAAFLAEKTEADQQLIEQLQIRKVRSMESDKFGGFTRITLVQPEPLEYDSDGIWKALKAPQRRLAFDENVNLNALPDDIRKAVIETIPKDALKAVTSHHLNLDKLAIAVKDEKIDAQIVSDHSSIKEIAASIRISHGSG
jgi:hypothetical protein